MNGEYSIAVHALVYLANHQHRNIPSEELAKNVCTNPARIRKIMAKLKRAYLVTTKEGSEGGYLLLPPQESITLKTVLDAVGTPVIKECWQSGSPELSCFIASGMSSVMDLITQDLNELCRQRLASITIKDITEKLLARKKERKNAAL